MFCKKSSKFVGILTKERPLPPIDFFFRSNREQLSTDDRTTPWIESSDYGNNGSEDRELLKAVMASRMAETNCSPETVSYVESPVNRVNAVTGKDTKHKTKPKKRGGQKRPKRLQFTRKKKTTAPEAHRFENILGQYPSNSGNDPQYYMVQMDNSKSMVTAEELKRTSPKAMEKFLTLPLNERELWEFAYILSETLDKHPYTNQWIKTFQVVWTASGYNPTWVLECNMHLLNCRLSDIPRGKKNYELYLKKEKKTLAFLAKK